MKGPIELLVLLGAVNTGLAFRAAGFSFLSADGTNSRRHVAGRLVGCCDEVNLLLGFEILTNFLFGMIKMEQSLTLGD